MTSAQKLDFLEVRLADPFDETRQDNDWQNDRAAEMNRLVQLVRFLAYVRSNEIRSDAELMAEDQWCEDLINTIHRAMSEYDIMTVSEVELAQAES